ncbi:hypothetical protein [Treponema putidum]|uniref:Uncharacterized protein n=1 Tax=Treponema putidum TaxID=221027 RepID=A0AAE9SKZ7_9SPIR|nr:hypothetical protein [Treponema putidum]UTY34772.1 hypothetical protein E4N74_12765 [Treponema putidum]
MFIPKLGNKAELFAKLKDFLHSFSEVMMFSIIGAKNNFTVSLKRFQNIANKNTIIKSSTSEFTKIEYKNVLPFYLKEKLKPLSFCINKNDKVLIKGENGIGKHENNLSYTLPHPLARF